MAGDDPHKVESITIKLRRLFSGERSTDAAALSALEHIDEIDKRLKANREVINRGVRRKTGRFSL